MAHENPNRRQHQLAKFNAITHVLSVIQSRLHIGYDDKVPEQPDSKVAKTMNKLREPTALATVLVQDFEVLSVMPVVIHRSELSLSLVTCVTNPLADFANSPLESFSTTRNSLNYEWKVLVNQTQSLHVVEPKSEHIDMKAKYAVAKHFCDNW
jgi:hypothetical protein